MVRLTRIYTRTGDTGETALGNGARVPKSAPRILLLGMIDEANAALGLARIETGRLAAAFPEPPFAEPDAMLARVQNELFDLGADISVPKEGGRSGTRLRVTVVQVDRLEQEIDRMNADLPPLESFILPGGAPAAAHIHMARAVVRRAEAAGWALAGQESVTQEALRYLNRLSDHLFVLARWINARTGQGDVLWQPGASR